MRSKKQSPAAIWIFLTVLLILPTLYLTHCGNRPGPFPPELSGDIRITVMDTTVVDSVFIELDDLPIGKWANPAFLNNIVAGLHQLFVYNESSAGTVKVVDVEADLTAAAWFWLTSISPQVGFQAPDFTVEDIDGKPISLEGLRGKVVIIALFEFT